MSDRADVVVVGAGFGGLGAALRLAERGARVVVCEALTYPGGCAGTFAHAGHRFEAGATLLCGFGKRQLFRHWIDAHGLPVELDWLDPVVELRTPSLRLAVPRDRAALRERFLTMPGAPREALARFFRLQGRVADTLWGLLDDPALLPPLGAGALARHVARLPRYLALTRLAGRPLLHLLRRLGLDSFAPLRTYLEGLCRITVQCGIEDAETPFALATMDYFHRGAAHVRGGAGVLAQALVEAVRRLGGEVVFANAVQRLERAPDGWRVHGRRGVLRAPDVVANVLPQDLRALLGASPGDIAPLDRLAARVESGWGACMLYLAARAPDGASPSAEHIEIVQDEGAPFLEGNHLFCSIGAGGDVRTMTVSTHVPMARLRTLDGPERADYVSGIQKRMREGLARFAPEWTQGIVHSMTASPRTFERFTRRHLGYVGGIPRRAGLRQYADLFPRRVLPGLRLVGDTVFPGQSTLAAALGGHRAAERIA